MSNTHQTSHLFGVSIAVFPTAAHPHYRAFPWAILNLWLLTDSADAALDRARELIRSADFTWTVATDSCRVSLAIHWRGPIPKAAQALTDSAQIVIEEDRASQNSDLPNFENMFGNDPLLTRQLNLNPQPCA